MFCDYIDKFLVKSFNEQNKLAFELHDVNDDGVICATDVFELMMRIKDHDYCLNEDFRILNRQLSE